VLGRNERARGPSPRARRPAVPVTRRCWAALVTSSVRRMLACFVGCRARIISGLLAGLKLNVRLELGTEGAVPLDAIGGSRGDEITVANAGRVQSAA